MCKPIRKRRMKKRTSVPQEFHDPVPRRPYTAWDDPMGDYNPYAIYVHPYNIKPESLRLRLYNGRAPNKQMLLNFVKHLEKF